MNKYSFDGDSFFILKAAQDCVINGKKYVKGQPITFFEHCKPILNYYRREIGPSNGINKISNYTEIYPHNLTIRGISKQESISNLIFTKKYDTIYTEEKVEEGTVDENGRIYLTCSDNVKVKQYFIFDENNDIVDYFQLTKNVLITSTIYSGHSFKIFYTIEHQQAPVNSFDCVTTKIPYLSGSIITKGKINGLDGKMIIEFPKLSCSTTPTLNF